MDAERLKSVAPFDSLSDQTRERFAVWVNELKVDAGRHLADQGDWAYELFMIEDGTASVVQDGNEIAELGPGEFFGEMGVLERGQRNATVIAKTPMTLLILSHWDVTRLRRDSPEWIAAVDLSVMQTKTRLVWRSPTAVHHGGAVRCVARGRSNAGTDGTSRGGRAPTRARFDRSTSIGPECPTR